MRVSTILLLAGIIGALSSSVPLRLEAAILPGEAEQPFVLAASAPTTYPAVAMAARAEGEVIVEVKIDAKGSVISTAVISGHNLLRGVSEKAAKHWQFSPMNDRTGIRAVRLTFAYIVVPDTDDSLEKNEVRMIFIPPYRVEIKRRPNYLH